MGFVGLCSFSGLVSPATVVGVALMVGEEQGSMVGEEGGTVGEEERMVSCEVLALLRVTKLYTLQSIICSNILFRYRQSHCPGLA